MSKSMEEQRIEDVAETVQKVAQDKQRRIEYVAELYIRTRDAFAAEVYKEEVKAGRLFPSPHMDQANNYINMGHVHDLTMAFLTRKITL